MISRCDSVATRTFNLQIRSLLLCSHLKGETPDCFQYVSNLQTKNL
jgi:hypothetical protein